MRINDELKFGIMVFAGIIAAIVVISCMVGQYEIAIAKVTADAARDVATTVMQGLVHICTHQ